MKLIFLAMTFAFAMTTCHTMTNPYAPANAPANPTVSHPQTWPTIPNHK